MKQSRKAQLTAGVLTLTTLLSPLGTTGCQQPTGPTEKGPDKPVPRTETITFKDGDLKFDVKYKALPTETALPAWLAYLETRLEAVVNGSGSNVAAVDYLMDQGSRFTIDVEYTGNNPGISWNTATQSFKIYNDWISTASGSDLSVATIRDAFGDVVIVAVRSNARETVRLAKTPADANGNGNAWCQALI